MFDLDLKSTHSYGSKSPGAIIDWAQNSGMDFIAICDIFQIPTFSNRETNPRVLNGAEFYCNLDGARVDLLFVDFDLTDDIVAFARNTRKLISDDLEGFRPPFYPHFDMSVSDKRKYIQSLPDCRATINEFKQAGAKVILDKVPFQVNKIDRFKTIKKVYEAGCQAVSVFKNARFYQNEKEELGEAIDICSILKMHPVIASGTYNDYENWAIPGMEAVESFRWLGQHIINWIDYS